MQNKIEQLQAVIDKLENENKQLKASIKHEEQEEAIGFDFIFNAVKQPLFLLESSNNKDAVIQRVNNSAIELLKYNKEEIYKLSPIEVGLFVSLKSFNQNQAILSKNEKISYLSTIHTKDGHSISSEITLFKFTSNDKNFFLVFQRNIGNQQKVVEALRQSEYRFLQMAENVIEGIVINEENNRVFVNSSLSKITGYTKEELKDMDELSLARKDEHHRIKAFKEKTGELKQGIHSLEYWIVTKGGQEKCLKTNYTFALKPNGKKSTYIISTDITTQKRVEQALRKSQSEFKMLAENSPDLITRYSHNLKYIYVNQTIERVTRIKTTDFIGKNNLELTLDQELVAFLEEMHLEVFRTGRTLKFEFRLQVGSGQKIFQAHMVPELSKNGAVDSVLNVARDITQIKKVEKNLKDEKELIVEENKLIGEQLIKWCHTLCVKNELNENIQANECLKPIMRIAEWAQHEAKIKGYTPASITVNSMLQEFFNSNAEHIKSNNTEASLFLPIPNITIFTDEELIKQSLKILLANAIEATGEGKIEIGFDIYNEKEVVFYIKDTGKGIAPEYTEAIFEPYVSIEKPDHPGLGLSIASKNVALFDGAIWCLSSPGTGSTFCFTHPAHIEKSLIHSRSQKEKDIWRDKTVIIVEDNDSNFLLLESILKKNKPKIMRAANGLDAVTLIKENKADIILMDIQLPGMNGYDVTKEVRRLNIETPIIAQTAYAMYNDVVKALDAGCNDFIPKPIKPKKLLNLMGKYLDEPEEL